MCIDQLAQQQQIPLDRVQHKALVGRGALWGQKVLLAKPQTYMNDSGVSIARLASFYKVSQGPWQFMGCWTEEIVSLARSSSAGLMVRSAHCSAMRGHPERLPSLRRLAPYARPAHMMAAHMAWSMHDIAQALCTAATSRNAVPCCSDPPKPFAECSSWLCQHIAADAGCCDV